MVFQCINIRQIPWEMLKTAAFALGFQHPHGTWRMLMHEKPCLIPILTGAKKNPEATLHVFKYRDPDQFINAVCS